MNKNLDDQIIIKIENLRVYYKNKILFNNLNLNINKNEIYGLIGETGSGKSELLNLLNGNLTDYFIEKGKIYINNIDVTNFKFSDWRKSNLRGEYIGYFLQSSHNYLDKNRKIKYQILESSFNNKKKNKNSQNKLILKAIKYLEKFSINEPINVLNSYLHELDELTIRKIKLIILLFLNPKILILDEILENLNSIQKYEILLIIKNIKKENPDLGILMISNDFSLVSKITDRIGIIYKGFIIEEGKTSELISSPLHPYTWELLDSIVNEKNTKKFTLSKNLELEGDPNFNEEYTTFSNKYKLEIDNLLNPPIFYLSDTHYVFSWLYDKRVKEKIKFPTGVKRRLNKK